MSTRGRTLVGWLVAAGAVASLGTACASDGSGPGPAPDARPDGSSLRAEPDDCSGRIDAQITSGEIPNADREYFIGMCQANR